MLREMAVHKEANCFVSKPNKADPQPREAVGLHRVPSYSEGGPPYSTARVDNLLKFTPANVPFGAGNEEAGPPISVYQTGPSRMERTGYAKRDVGSGLGPTAQNVRVEQHHSRMLDSPPPPKPLSTTVRPHDNTGDKQSKGEYAALSLISATLLTTLLYCHCSKGEYTALSLISATFQGRLHCFISN